MGGVKNKTVSTIPFETGECFPKSLKLFAYRNAQLPSVSTFVWMQEMSLLYLQLPIPIIKYHCKEIVSVERASSLNPV